MYVAAELSLDKPGRGWLGIGDRREDIVQCQLVRELIPMSSLEEVTGWVQRCRHFHDIVEVRLAPFHKPRLGRLGTYLKVADACPEQGIPTGGEG